MKTILLFLSLSLLCCEAQLGSPNSGRRQQSRWLNHVASACNQWITQTSDNDYWETGPKSQFIQVTNPITVCSVITKVSTGGSPVNIYYTFWSGKTGGQGGTNTLYGISNTNSVNIADISPDWTTNSCSVLLTNDTWVVQGSVGNADIIRARWRSSTTGPYDSTTYYLHAGPSGDKTGSDFCFIVKVQ